MVALIFGNRGPRFRSKDAVDLTAIVTLLREGLLSGGYVRVAGLDGLIRITVLVVIRSRIVRAGIVAVLVRITVAVGVVIRVIPIWPPRIEAGVKDEPRAVEEVATVTVPPMVAATIPVAPTS